MRGLVCLVKQVAGGGLGIVLVSSLLSLPAGGPSVPIHSDWVAGMFPFFVLGLCLTFQMAGRDLLPAALVSLLAYFGVLGGTALFGAMIGTLIGTIVAVGASQVWARRTGRPSTILLIPAVVTLISGAAGFRGLAEIWQGNTNLGLQNVTHMFIVALTVLAGLLIGNGLFKGDDAIARAVKEKEQKTQPNSMKLTKGDER
ncbi:MAG: threonine/serine exporter family protein [Verrucomicrobiales bacterium]|nr:threonine/serine exporter family protein [Verrucomicrobiales bacterium]